MLNASLRLARRAGFGLAGLGICLLSGCGSMMNLSSVSEPVSEAAKVGGAVYGGQYPVSGATVSLYEAGIGGYGGQGTNGAVKLAVTTSDSNGNFAFTKNAGTATPGSPTSTYACDSARPNAQIYILAQGGNTQGTGSSTNSAAAFLAAIGQCGSISSSTHLTMNELTTAASVLALAPYINPGSTPGTETVGTSSTTQGALGLNNAVASIANLVNMNNGQLIAPPQYAGTGSAAGITVTATAESTKLNTIADILASCINTPTSASTACADLMNSAAVPVLGSATSQPSATYSAATDVVQAAFYMAVNPADLGTFTSCNSSGSATSNIACLYSLAGALAPFQPTLSSQPSDWTVGVSFTSTGTCAASSGGTISAGGFIQGPVKTAIDASGNVWFLGGGTSAAGTVPSQYLSEMSPVGQPLQCLTNPGSAAGLSAGRGLVIDPTGNVWASFNGSGTTYDVEELPAGGSALINWPTSGPGITSYGLGVDGGGNIYFSGIANGGTVYRFAVPGTTTTPTTPTQYLGPLATNSGTNNTTNLAFSTGGTAWVAGTSNSGVYVSYPVSSTTASITADSVAHSSSNAYSTVTFTTSAMPSFTAGQQVTISGLTGSNATALSLNQTVYVASVTSTGFTATVPSSTTQTALASQPDSGTATVNALDTLYTSLTATPYGLALDNSGNAYTGGTCCGSASPYRTMGKLVPTTPGSAPTVTRSALYAGGINGVRSLVLDGAGNAWMGNEYSSNVANTAATTGFVVSEINAVGSSFVSLSPDGTAPAGGCSTTVACPTGGGFIKDSFGEARDLAVDPSGNVWVMNTGSEASTYGGANITEIIGAAVPVVTPLSVATANTQLATKP